MTDFLLDSCRSLLLCQLLLYQIPILNQCIGKFLPVVHHAVMLPAGEMRFQQKPVDFCDCKEEGKHMVRPPLNCPHNLNTNKTVSLCIVIIDKMENLEVVVYHLWILEHLGCHHTTFLPITSCLLSAMPGIHLICRHKQHDTIQFLLRVDMKWNIIYLASP